MKDTVIKLRDNAVAFQFDWDKKSDFYANGLNEFTNIEVEIGTETYTLTGNPTNVIIESPTELHLRIGTVTTLAEAAYDASIIGFSPTYPNGYILTSPEKRILKGKVKVRD